jgi:hypothetical protein
MASAPNTTGSTSAAVVPPGAPSSVNTSTPAPGEAKKDAATALDDGKGKGKDVSV